MQKQLFNYDCIKVLGEGGMSRVYLGEDPITHQKVAIKELLPNLAHSKDLRDRFRREAQIMAKLDHPNIVKLIRYEETTTSFYLIMEYVDGMDLEQHIKDVTGPISEPKAIEIMSTLLDAFGYAHEKGVVHRDIKPANFIITRDGKIKVLDFGIAKIVDEDASGRTKTGTRIGTVAYMSPEQVNAAPDIDLRTDIYSLGVMLHQIITGKPAYDTTTSSDFEVQTQIVKEPLPRANTIYPYTSDHLQTLIDKATQKKRENRFQDCDQFKLALFKKNQKPLPPPPPPKDEDPSNWVPLFIFLVIIVCVIIFIANYKKSNSDNYPAVEMVDTTAVVVDTAAVVTDSVAVVVDPAAEFVDTAAAAVDPTTITPKPRKTQSTPSNSSPVRAEQFREDYDEVYLYNSGTGDWGVAKSESTTFVFNYNDNNDVIQYLGDGSKKVYTNISTNNRFLKTAKGINAEIDIRDSSGKKGTLSYFEDIGVVVIEIGNDKKQYSK
jgi:serine/threonine protein kinase